MSDDTSDWLTEREELEADLGDTGHSITVLDVTEAELNELEAMADDGDEGEVEAIKHAIREYLLEPDVDPEEMMMRKRQLVWVSMQRVWSGADEIKAAFEDLDLPGNG